MWVNMFRYFKLNCILTSFPPGSFTIKIETTTHNLINGRPTNYPVLDWSGIKFTGNVRAVNEDP